MCDCSAERINPFPTVRRGNDGLCVEWPFCHSLTLPAPILVVEYTNGSRERSRYSGGVTGFFGVAFLGSGHSATLRSRLPLAPRNAVTGRCVFFMRVVWETPFTADSLSLP
ncbi:MAG: hypothetical protein ACRC46_12540 [Thermoguttaceae bacterium]